MAASSGRVVFSKLSRCFNVTGSCVDCVLQRCLYCSTSTTYAKPPLLGDTQNQPSSDSPRAKKISKAMLAYLERAKEHDKFMTNEIDEYEIGKRHLANIMGADPDSFGQEDIDRAIEYLLPSGLYDKKARPVFKHPEEIIPVRKAAQFGMDGRPFHYLFYTMKPNFYQIMHEAAMKSDSLKQYEDTMIGQGHHDHSQQTKIPLDGSEWIDRYRLEQIVIEKITEKNYNQFVTLMSRLCGEAYSLREQEFIMRFRRKLDIQSYTEDIKPPMVDESGRRYMDGEGQRKTATASVRVWETGTGLVTINGTDLLYFRNIYEREAIMFPLQFLNKLGRVDIEATTEGGGPSAQAGAVRLALSRALCSLVDKETVERMRLAGLLTWDVRKKERKKPGQKRARKKFTWKKR